MTDTPQNIIKTVALLVPTLAAGFCWSRNVVVTPTSLRRLGPLRCFDSSSECRPSSEAFQFLEKKIQIGHSWVAHFPGIGLSEHEFFAWALLNSTIRIVVEGAIRRWCLVLGCSCLNNTYLSKVQRRKPSNWTVQNLIWCMLCFMVILIHKHFGKLV